MNKQEFCDLYYLCLEEAVVNAECHNAVTLPRQFEIEFHGLGFSREFMDADLACDFLYLGDDEFVFLVDLAVMRATEDLTTVFLRVSDHTHTTRFEETFNYREGRGPFKQLISLQFQK
jgi:hypothetical protein